MKKSLAKVVIGSPNRIAVHWSDEPGHAAVVEDMRTGSEARLSVSELALLANCGGKRAMILIDGRMDEPEEVASALVRLSKRVSQFGIDGLRDALLRDSQGNAIGTADVSLDEARHGTDDV